METLQILTVGTRMTIESIYPRSRHQFYKVVIACQVLRKHYQMIASAVILQVVPVLLSAASHIHLAATDRLERLQPFFLTFLVELLAAVKQLLNAKHVAVIGNCQAPHSVAYRFVNQFGNGRHTVQYRVVRMYVKVYEIFHFTK